MLEQNWIAKFPGLAQLAAGDVELLVNNGQVVELKAGTRIFGRGQAPESYLLLLDGRVRVQQVSDSGREIVLYRVARGESCALTTACLMGYEDYQAEGIAETNIKAVAIARSTFDRLIASSAAFRQFVFAAFSDRITNLFQVLEDVAFSRIDLRLAQKLLALMDDEQKVKLTHQQLANELGTAREVISRQLHEFQRRGWIATSRGAIAVCAPESLQALVASA